MEPNRVELATDGGTLPCQLLLPEGQGPWAAVIMYMDALGIRPSLIDMARRLAVAGYVVLVPDLYYRSGPYEPFDPSKAFGEGPEHDRMRAFLKAVDNALVMRDTDACVQYLDSRSDVRGEAIGCVGYCMGGRQALMAAGMFPDRIRAAASIHGAALATDRDGSPHRLASRMRARLYIGVAEIDHTFSREEQARLEDALRAGGVSFTLELYEQARHGFAMPDHPAYNAAAAERQWNRVLALFAKSLQ